MRVKYLLTVTGVLLASILWLGSNLTGGFGVLVMTSAGLDLNIWPAAWTTEKLQIITHGDTILVKKVECLHNEQHKDYKAMTDFNPISCQQWLVTNETLMQCSYEKHTMSRTGTAVMTKEGFDLFKNTTRN